MDLTRIAVRALIVFMYLFVVVRLSGKRVVGQATPFDFVLALILGDLVDDALWAEVSAAEFFAAVGTLVVADLVVKLIAFYNDPFHRLVHGLPSTILRRGVEDGHALRREQMNESDLAHLLRLEGVDDWNEVEVAYLEQDHSASVILREDCEPAQKQDL